MGDKPDYLKDYSLICFDIDGTLADRDRAELYPDVAPRLSDIPNNPFIVLVSNQGGVGLRSWMETMSFGEPEKYPNRQSVRARIYRLAIELGSVFGAYISLAYESKSSDQWWPKIDDEKLQPPYESDPSGWCKESWLYGWRKPNPGMIHQAIEDFGIKDKSKVLMVGDRDEDREAARLAGVDFAWAKDFFGRDDT